MSHVRELIRLEDEEKARRWRGVVKNKIYPCGKRGEGASPIGRYKIR
jgi:hypothetical protein